MAPKKSPLEEMLEIAQSEKAFTSSPEELHDLYGKSRHILKTFRTGLNDTTIWSIAQQHFYLALMTGHDSEAELMLNKLSDRFGSSSEKIVLFRSQYIEATQGLEAADEFLRERDERELVCLLYFMISLQLWGL